MRKVFALLIAMLLMAVSIVPLAAQEEASDDTTFFRVAHLSPTTPPVVVFINGEPFFSGLRFGSITAWQEVPAGTYEVAVGTSSNIANAAIGPVELTLEANRFVTIAAIGAGDTLRPHLIEEDYSPIGRGNGRVTIFHAIEGAPVVDVLANGSPLVTVLGFPGTLGSNNGYVTAEVPAGSYDVSVVNHLDNNQVILSAPGFEVAANTNTIVVAAGTPDNPRVVVVVTSQDEIAERVIFGDGEARVRIAHLVPDGPPVTVFVNGEIRFSGLRFGTLTRFVPLAAPGTYEIIVSTNSNPANAIIGPVDLTFEDDTFTTIAAIGSAGAGTIEAAVIPEDYTGEGDNAVSVIVFHAIADAPPVDVVVRGGPTLITALAYPGSFITPTGAFNDGVFELIVPPGTYDIDVFPNAVRGEPVLSLEGATLTAGTRYFVIAAGSLGGGTARLIVEAYSPDELED